MKNILPTNIEIQTNNPVGAPGGHILAADNLSPNVVIFPESENDNQVHTQNIMSESRNGTAAKDASTLQDYKSMNQMLSSR
jgi:hypothetical protein